MAIKFLNIILKLEIIKEIDVSIGLESIDRLYVARRITKFVGEGKKEEERKPLTRFDLLRLGPGPRDLDEQEDSEDSSQAAQNHPVLAAGRHPPAKIDFLNDHDTTIPSVVDREKRGSTLLTSASTSPVWPCTLPRRGRGRGKRGTRSRELWPPLEWLRDQARIE